MAVQTITRRWLLNSFAVIVIIIVMVEIAFAVGISNYFYASVQQILGSQSSDTADILQRYEIDPTGEDVAAFAQSYVSGFAQQVDRRFELMTVGQQGTIVLTSSGFLPEQPLEMEALSQALLSPGTAIFENGTLNGQRVMTCTIAFPQDMQRPTFAAIQMVTGIDAVNQQIVILVLLMLTLGILILAMVLFSSSYFISSIVNPIGEVGKTARRIAQGDFAARLDMKSQDEIGELCEIINYMASELATAEQLKNDFISSVSHELRTPLTAIQGWSETILADEGADKEVLRRGMRVVISETGRLSQMVEELLDFSRMQSGRLRLVKAKMDVLAELSEAVLMYTERAKREGIALCYEDTDQIAPVYGDKNKLRQVFVNVIDNAIKYSDNGGTVTVTVVLDHEKITIQVQDTGIGIREEDLAQVKKKFYKANSTRRGSGIGLAVADEIITRHDGTLTVASRYHQGTTVTIDLPLCKEQDTMLQVSDDLSTN